MDDFETLKSHSQPVNPYMKDGKYPYESFFQSSTLSGQLSPCGKKLLSHAVIFFASMTVWGDVSNLALVTGICGGLCASLVPFAVILTLVSGGFLLVNVGMRTGNMSRYGLFTHFREFLFMLVLYVLLAVILVSIASVPDAAVSNTGLGMSWICFFFAFYGSFEAYHTYQEADEPEDPEKVQDLLDGDDFIYG